MKIERELGVKRHIGQKLHEARRAAGFNKITFAQKIEITPQQLRKYENGTDQISIARLLQISEVLSLGLNYFLKDIQPVEWDENITEDQRASLNISNNFMKIKDKPCRRAISSLLAVLARIAGDENIIVTEP